MSFKQQAIHLRWLEIFRFFVKFCFWMWVFIPNSFAQERAQHLYTKYEDSVFQIQVIDAQTDKKATIGSGFCFSPEGHVATNYHVVSKAIMNPDQYRVEYLTEKGGSGDLKVIGFDVIHDLAILAGDFDRDQFFPLGNSEMSNGARIYSLGNPHDLGMSIVEGTYNGLMEQSMYEKILFSGSLNSGMSGGPAVNPEGWVIGVNVATAGNQISFLVPVEFLITLYHLVRNDQNYFAKPRKEIIGQQLFDNQERLVQQNILAKPWDNRTIDFIQVPGEFSTAFKCWGDSKKPEEEGVQVSTSYMSCSSQDWLFIDDDFRTGNFFYEYQHMKTDKLTNIQFYNYYQALFSDVFVFNNASKEDVSNFECHNDFVNLDGLNWQMSLCARRYDDFPELFDMHLNVASVDYKYKGVMILFVALGVSQDNVQLLSQRFLEAIRWNR